MAQVERHACLIDRQDLIASGVAEVDRAAPDVSPWIGEAGDGATKEARNRGQQRLVGPGLELWSHVVDRDCKGVTARIAIIIGHNKCYCVLTIVGIYMLRRELIRARTIAEVPKVCMCIECAGVGKATDKAECVAFVSCLIVTRLRYRRHVFHKDVCLALSDATVIICYRNRDDIFVKGRVAGIIVRVVMSGGEGSVVFIHFHRSIRQVAPVDHHAMRVQESGINNAAR